MNLNPLVNIDVETYSGIGCYIPHDGYDNWNNYFKIYHGFTPLPDGMELDGKNKVRIKESVPP